ncbi:hypothetical protein TSH7_09050 [Azospirillum sp. TSH7]|uniref:lipopolysaccharide biosynthesis protein n=1 Tax=unclassified Azospirillum TaxID=2630922 RepID=UPI000D60FD38|nr:MULTISPECIES: lipopolysaccharide biosynthesis protein [unclassified Azospirillum]PWC62804.1 hypothetical protein TSH20_21110 [Azospirillum sp. TSH20]PWC65188.1 hypothetical protein TSH7_09050 [Azospirillum sp. TSH7]
MRLIVRARSVSRHPLSWALVDQAVASGANFLTIVILARQLGVEGFGLFMLAWLVLLFFRSLQGGLIIAPMMSIGPKQEPQRRDAYYGVVLACQLVLVVGGSAFILCGAWVIALMAPGAIPTQIAVPLAAACAGDQLQEFARRLFFSQDRPRLAVLVDVTTYGSRTLLLLLFGGGTELALWFVFLSALPGMGVTLYGLAGLRLTAAAMREFLPRQWRFARWTVGAALLEWGSGHLIVMVAGGVLGTAAVGAIRATTNIFAPVQVLIQALNNVVPVRAAALLAEGGERPLVRYLTRVTALSGAVCLAILAVGTGFPAHILLLLYGPGYEQYAHLVYWWVAIYAAGFLQFPLSAALSAIELTRPFFLSILCEAAFGIVSAWVLPHWFGLDGTMFGILVTRAAPVLVLGLCLTGWWRHSMVSPRPADIRGGA